MQEEAIKASNNSDVPNLVTNLNQSQASDTNSVAYRLAQAAKEKDLSSQMVPRNTTYRSVVKRTINC